MKIIQADWLGHGNLLPPNFNIVDIEEYYPVFNKIFHRGGWASKWLVKLPKDHTMYGAKLTLFVDENSKTGCGIGETAFWPKHQPEFYFTFAHCVHEFVERKNTPMFENVYDCKHCDYVYSTDSS